MKKWYFFAFDARGRLVATKFQNVASDPDTLAEAFGPFRGLPLGQDHYPRDKFANNKCYLIPPRLGENKMGQLIYFTDRQPADGGACRMTQTQPDPPPAERLTTRAEKERELIERFSRLTPEQQTEFLRWVLRYQNRKHQSPSP